jgi:hypothetical protein
MLIAQQLEKLNLQAAADKSMSQGIAGAMPQEMADGVVSAAGGGILAFNKRGLTPTTDLSEGEGELTEEGPDDMPIYGTAPADLLARASRSSAAISKINPTTLTPEQKSAAIRSRYNLEKSLAGPDTASEEYLGMINKGDTDRAEMRGQGKGLAALAAAAGLVQGNNLARGLGQASGAFAQAYAPVLQADRKEKMALASMKFNLLDAQRKERMGMTKSAIAAAAEATKDQQAADKFALDKTTKQAEIDARIAAAGRPIRTGSGAGGPKPEKVWERYATETTNLNALARKLGPDFATNPEYIAKKQDVEALGVIAQQSKDVQPVKASQTDTAQADKRTAAEAAAWSQTYKGRQAQKSYAIANNIETGMKNPKWREEAREHHRKNFGKTAPAGGSTVINFDANGQPIQ